MDRPGLIRGPCLQDTINLPCLPAARSSFPYILSGSIVVGGAQALCVISVDPFESREHHIIGSAPRSFPLDELFLVKVVQRLGCRVIVRIALAADRTDGADFAEPLRMADRSTMNPAITIEPNSV